MVTQPPVSVPTPPLTAPSPTTPPASSASHASPLIGSGSWTVVGIAGIVIALSIVGAVIHRKKTKRTSKVSNK
jgi:hypothetical protein